MQSKAYCRDNTRNHRDSGTNDRNDDFRDTDADIPCRA
jgi:hypothetical protein